MDYIKIDITGPAATTTIDRQEALRTSQFIGGRCLEKDYERHR